MWPSWSELRSSDEPVEKTYPFWKVGVPHTLRVGNHPGKNTSPIGISMSNPLSKIPHVIELAANDVWKVVDFLPHAVAVLTTAIKDEPTVKTLITELVQQAGAVITDTTLAATKEGIDLTADAAALAAAEAFFTWFKGTFIPGVEQIYKDIAAQV